MSEHNFLGYFGIGPPILPEDNGRYTLLAYNEYGTVNKSVEVLVRPGKTRTDFMCLKFITRNRTRPKHRNG